jgi:hypothetical protein
MNEITDESTSIANSIISNDLNKEQHNQQQQSNLISSSNSLSNHKNRPKVYRIKKEINDFNYLCLDHKDQLTMYYDYYMEFKPSIVRKIFQFLFPINRLTKLLLVHFLFYHTVWWSNNSTSNNLAINYSAINKFLFYSIAYFNFYDILVGTILIKFVLFNLFKQFHFITLSRLKSLLSILELLIYISVVVFLIYSFKFEQNMSAELISIIIIPHVIFLIYNKFDISIKLFNFTLFSNQTNISLADCIKEELIVSLDNEDDNVISENQNESNNNSTTFVYTDCSNLSIDAFLNQRHSIPCILTPLANETSNSNLSANTNGGTNNKSLIQQASLNSKMIKQSINRTKISKTKQSNMNSNSKKIFSKISCSFISFFSSFPKTSQIIFRKRNTFTYINKLDSISHLNHKCQKDPFKIRNESNQFKLEYNNRLCETILKTFESVYFNFIITRLLVPSNINLREKEYFIFFSSSFITTLLSYWCYYIPFSFLSSLNRNSEHLGKWVKDDIDQKSNEIDYNKWVNSKIYFKNDAVNYNGKIYKVESLYCASIPGNKFHERFFKIFSKPFRIIKILLVIELIGKGLICVYFYINTRWYSTITNIVEILFNSHVFFVIIRDYLILNEQSNIYSSKVVPASLSSNNNNNNSNNINNKKID